MTDIHAEQTVKPAGGVYAIVDLASKRIVFVGRSTDVQRRLAWWRGAGRQFADPKRYGGVQIAHTDDVPTQRGMEQKALEAYGGPDPAEAG